MCLEKVRQLCNFNKLNIIKTFNGDVDCLVTSHLGFGVSQTWLILDIFWVVNWGNLLIFLKPSFLQWNKDTGNFTGLLWGLNEVWHRKSLNRVIYKIVIYKTIKIIIMAGSVPTALPVKQSLTHLNMDIWISFHKYNDFKCHMIHQNCMPLWQMISDSLSSYPKYKTKRSHS